MGKNPRVKFLPEFCFRTQGICTIQPKIWFESNIFLKFGHWPNNSFFLDSANDRTMQFQNIAFGTKSFVLSPILDLVLPQKIYAT